MVKRKGRRRPTMMSRSREGVAESEPLLGNSGLHGADDVCFVCKDGGNLVICDNSICTKAYHRTCLTKDEDSSHDDFACRWHTCFICKQPSSYQCFCCPDVSVCVSCLTKAQFARLTETKGFCINCLRIVVTIERNNGVSEGEKVDFEKLSYEYFFKRYWKALNREECLKLDELEKAYNYLNSSPKFTEVSDLKNLNSEDDSNLFMEEKTRTMNSKSSTFKRSSHGNRESFAALVPANINLIYLRRSLAKKLLNQPKTFESKVVGCFVRMKLKYQLDQGEWRMLGRVTGIGKSSEEYKIDKTEDTSTDMLLYIFDRCPVKISMLLNEEIMEKECEDLQLLVQKKNFKRLTVAELESKEKSVHCDMVNHRIDTEIKSLGNLAEQANVAGRRKEKHECLKKIQLLRTEHERKRQLDEAPRVIPDVEDKDSDILFSEPEEKRVKVLLQNLEEYRVSEGFFPPVCSQSFHA